MKWKLPERTVGVFSLSFGAQWRWSGENRVRTSFMGSRLQRPESRSSCGLMCMFTEMICTSTPCADIHLAIYPSYVSADKGQEANSAESWLQIRGSPVSCASILGHLVFQRLRSGQVALGGTGTSPIPSHLVTP